jgi:hypothetical protein
MRLIDADAFEDYVFDEWNQNEISNGDWIQFREWLKDQETVVEFEGDINKVIVKGEEYYKQLTTTWLGNYCPYRCEHCGHYSDSKTPYCAWCGRRATNYD